MINVKRLYKDTDFKNKHQKILIKAHRKEGTMVKMNKENWFMVFTKQPSFHSANLDRKSAPQVFFNSLKKIKN